MVRQHKKIVEGFVWFVLFIWLNQMNQINQINKTNQISLSASGLLLAGTPLRG
jgi:hypothetical protein